MKTLIEIDKHVWAKVKDFATIEEESISSAVENLLAQALKQLGYSIQKGE